MVGGALICLPDPRLTCIVEHLPGNTDDEETRADAN